LKSRSKVSRKVAETIEGNKMHLTPDDLAITAAACRGLAERYREDAKRLESTAISEAALVRAHHSERLAEFFELEREREKERLRTKTLLAG
jgi:predicted DNA-binding transcriptional regulator YafY